MISRRRLFAQHLIATHPTGQMAGQSGKGRTASRSIAVLEISDHECRGARQGDFEGKRKLTISDSV
jgi:hypothetical protein